MSFGNALLYSLVGILTVFFALILLMCIIKIMTAAGDRAEQNATAKAEAKAGKAAGKAGTEAAAGSGAALATGKAGAGAVGAARVASAASSGAASQAGTAGVGAASQSGAAGAAAPAGPLAPGSAGEVKLYDTPPAVSAMLMAIVADELKTPLNELRFISIREIREEES